MWFEATSLESLSPADHLTLGTSTRQDVFHRTAALPSLRTPQKGSVAWAEWSFISLGYTPSAPATLWGCSLLSSILISCTLTVWRALIVATAGADTWFPTAWPVRRLGSAVAAGAVVNGANGPDVIEVSSLLKNRLSWISTSFHYLVAVVHHSTGHPPHLSGVVVLQPPCLRHLFGSR